MFSLAKEMCPSFGTCESHGDASVNEALEFAFSDMKEAIDDEECNFAASVLKDRSLSILPIPLVQGAPSFAAQNDGSQPLSTAPGLAAGHVLTETLLPQISEVSETSAAALTLAYCRIFSRRQPKL